MHSSRRGFLQVAGAGVVAGAAAVRSGSARESGPVKAASPEILGVTMRDTTELAKANVPPEENELSRRCLRIIEKWIPVGVEYFANWPVRPRCGHFFGGVHWYGQETLSPAETFAVASVSPEYDEKATAVPRAQLRELAIQAVRYLAFTHDTGPPDCVRPAVGLGRPENRGVKWGERGKGFFKESQCGTGVAILGRICLLLRDQLDDETWMMVARIHEDYARRFGDMPPQSGVYVNTQMEENAWTSAGLASCYLFLSRHKSAPAWEAIARRWMFSTCTTPQDAKDLGPVGRSRASALTANIFTALPDYWAENHGMVHPSYTASGVWPLITAGCQLRLWGRELPPELLWNRQRIYENLKRLTDGAGYCQAIQGMDWHYLPAAGSASPHAVAAVLFADAAAAAIERRALRNTELRQEGNGGRLYDRQLAEKAHDQQDPMIMREITIDSIAQLYLFHRLFGPGPEPTSDEELEKRLRGVRVFPHAGFAHHRHAHGQTSLSWHNSCMALPLTREGIYTVAPCSNSWLGAPVVRAKPDSQRLVSVKVDESQDAFAAALVIERCQEAIRQQVLVASLPNGRMLSWERFRAREDLVLESLDQGFLRITNETFPQLGENSRGVRILHFPGGQKEYRGGIGQSPSDDLIDVRQQPEWLNVDDRIGVRFTGPGATIYHNRHFFQPYRAVADDLVLSRLKDAQPLRAGQATLPLAAVLILEQNHRETPASELQLWTGPDDMACVATNGFAVAANFQHVAQACVFTRPRPVVVPAYAGATVDVRGQSLQCMLTLAAGSARLLEAVAELSVDGEVRVDVTPRREIHVANLGKQPARVVFADDSRPRKPRELAPGEIAVL